MKTILINIFKMNKTIKITKIRQIKKKRLVLQT